MSYINVFVFLLNYLFKDLWQPYYIIINQCGCKSPYIFLID